jgi:hypothetical protein
VKSGIAARFRVVQPIFGASEKGAEKDSSCPYLEPTQVSLGEKPKACRVYTIARELGNLAPYLWYKGCLQFLPLAGTAGRSGIGVPTV